MASKKKVKIGRFTIGGNEPVRVQSMLNTPAGDCEAAVKQAKELENAGCEIIRATVPDKSAATKRSKPWRMPAVKRAFR